MKYSIFGYLVGEGFRNVFKNKKSTMASLMIMCATMFIFGIFFIVGQNINHLTKTVEEQQGMNVFIFDETSEQEKRELETKIRTNPYVNNVQFTTKEEALEKVKKMFKGKQSLFANYEKPENNPFKASYTVTLTDLSKAEEVKSAIENEKGVSSVEMNTESINALITIAKGIKIVSGIILIILICICIFIITNTIKLTVHARRKEISIMRYVGATNSFIRWPFMVEGMMIGFIAVLISLVIIAGSYNVIITKAEQFLIEGRINIPLLSLQDIFTPILVVFLVLGIGIGALGSAISMRKYLKV